MSDTFHSCEITPAGISVKVLRDGVGHRVALGIGDFAGRAQYIAAVAALLESHLGANLAAVAAVVSANKADKEAAVNALKAEHAAQVAALEADLATLGTKEEAREMRKQRAVAKLQEQIAADNAKLSALLSEQAKP